MAKTIAAVSQSLHQKMYLTDGGDISFIFAETENAPDPFALRKTANGARELLAHNMASMSRACASAVSGSSGLSDEDTVRCFYGIAQMCDFLEALTELHDNATYECIKRSERQSHE